MDSSGLKCINFSAFKCFKYLLLFCLMVQKTASQSLKEAEDKYQRAQYSESRSIYGAMINQGHKDARLYFNLANCYFKEGNYGYALLNYYRAGILDPQNAQIQKNIILVRRKSNLDGLAYQSPGIRNIFVQLATLWNSQYWLILCCVLGVWLLLVFYQFISFPRNWKLLMLPIALLLIMILIQEWSKDRESKYRVLVMDSPVYTSPDSLSPVLRTLKSGEILNPLDQIDPWIKVEDEAKQSGWLEKSKAIEIRDWNNF